nr:tyrosine-type recombinase/integrase [Thermotoga sp.]
MQAGVFDRKVSTRAVRKALKKYDEKAGITRNVTPHMFRHTLGVELAKRGTHK